MTTRLTLILACWSILASTLTQAVMVHFSSLITPLPQVYAFTLPSKSSASISGILSKNHPDPLIQMAPNPLGRRIPTAAEIAIKLKAAEDAVSAYKDSKAVWHLTASLDLLAKAGELVRDHDANMLILDDYLEVYKLAVAEMDPNFDIDSPSYQFVSRIPVPSESEMASDPSAKIAYDAAVTENHRRAEYSNQQVELKHFMQLYKNMFSIDIERIYHDGRVVGSHAELQQLLDQHPEMDPSLKSELLAALSYDEVAQ